MASGAAFKLGVAITANDKTARGVNSAIGRLKGVPKAANDVGTAVNKTKKALDGLGSAKTRGGLSATARTFGEVDRAMGGAASSITSKFGVITKVTSALGTGFGEAAAAGSAMEGAVAAVGVAAAATAAVLVGIAFASDKLATSWASGALGAKNLADTIGVSTKALQEFQAAAERVGVDKQTAAGAVGGLSQTLNDAVYGRNPAAMATLARLGVRIQRNADGTVNTEAMLPAIADAIARQNSSGQRTVAQNLGIGAGALPMFRQGGKQLAADMADSARFTDTPEQVALAQRFTRKRAVAGQASWRAKDEGLAIPAANAEDALLGSNAAARAGAAFQEGARTIGSALQGDFKPAVREFHAAVDAFRGMVASGGATPAASASVTGPGAAASLAAISRAAAQVGVNPGTMAAIAYQESRLNPRIRAAGKGQTATGLFQFIDQTWLGMLRSHGVAHGYGWATNAISHGRRGWEVSDPALRARVLALRTDPDANALMGAEAIKDYMRAGAQSPGAIYMSHFLGPAKAARFALLEASHPNAGAADYFPREAGANRGIFYDRQGHERTLAQVLELMSSLASRPIKLEVSGLPSGARVTAKGGHGQVAVAHAMTAPH